MANFRFRLGSNRLVLATLFTLSLCTGVEAAQVPNPVNAPASSTAGHIATYGSSSQQLADSTFAFGTSGSVVCVANANCIWSGNDQLTGGVEIGSPTGGMPGAGILNAAAINVNNVAVSVGAVSCATHNFVSIISTSVAPTCSQPTASDITSGTMSGDRISGGTLVTIAGIVVNNSALINAFGSTTIPVEVLGTTAGSSAYMAARFSNNANGAGYFCEHSRGTVFTSFTTLQTNDVECDLNSYGADGTGFVNSATWECLAVGTISTGVVPGKCQVKAANSSGTLTIMQTWDANADTVTFPRIATDATHTDSTVCQDTTTHAIYAGSGTLGTCLGTSSKRFKKSIKDMSVGLLEVMRLHPETFLYKRDFGDGGARPQYGFMAEDVVKVLPGLVGLDKSRRPNTVDILGMVPVLTLAVQAQQRMIEMLILLVVILFVWSIYLHQHQPK